MAEPKCPACDKNLVGTGHQVLLIGDVKVGLCPYAELGEVHKIKDGTSK